MHASESGTNRMLDRDETLDLARDPETNFT